MLVKIFSNKGGGFNTQPRGGGCERELNNINEQVQFQHTAARRRLLEIEGKYTTLRLVSTHSRAEAAAPYIKK